MYDSAQGTRCKQKRFASNKKWTLQTKKETNASKNGNRCKQKSNNRKDEKRNCWMLVSFAIKKTERIMRGIVLCPHKNSIISFSNSSSHLIFNVRDSTLEWYDIVASRCEI